MRAARVPVILSALLSAVLVNASPYQSSHVRRAVAVIPGFESSGCWTDSTSARVLTGDFYADDSMTAEKCAAACEGFHIFGVEYGREVCHTRYLLPCLSRVF